MKHHFIDVDYHQNFKQTIKQTFAASMKSTMIQQNLPTPVLSIDMKLKRTLIASAIAGLSLFSLTSNAMEKADLMITDAMVLTMNQDKHVYANGTVVVKDNKIIAVGANTAT